MEALDTRTFETITIPCSGTGHWTDRRLHGDPKLPAKFVVRLTCPYCPKNVLRPVCEYFVEHGMSGDRVINCSNCHKNSFADEAFTVVGPL
jgi:hypothetical protein